MRRTVAAIISWLRRPLQAWLITFTILICVGILDYLTGPFLEFSVLYFLPITYAAWALGRNVAILVAVLSEIETSIEQTMLVRAGITTTPVAVGTALVRLLVYLFVAEVTYRLVTAMAEARQAVSQLHETYARLDEDVRAAGQLQKTMLAFSAPVVPGCEIGATLRYPGQTGGDFVDAGTLDGQVYVAVADISGKGTPAALFTTLLRHLLTDVFRRGLRGRAAVRALNVGLCGTIPSETFITLFYAEFDPRTGRLDYVNAGHTEGLLYRHETEDLELVGPTGPLLGYCNGEPGIMQAQLTLRPGDVLVLHTDGATESKSLTGERLGETLVRLLVRSHAHLRPQEMADRICNRIEAATDARFRDDLAMLCLKLTGEELDSPL